MARVSKKANNQLNTQVYNQDFTATQEASATLSLDQTSFGLDEDDFAAVDAALEEMSQKNVTPTNTQKESTPMTQTTSNSTPATTTAITSNVNDNELTKSDKAANTFANRGEGRFNYSECMERVITEKSRAAIEEIQRHIDLVWLKDARAAVAKLAPEDPYATSEHKANRQRIKQLLNIVNQMSRNCEQVLLPVGGKLVPMSLSKFVKEMRDHKVLTLPLLDDNFSYYDRYQIMNGDQEARAYCGIQWLSGKLPQYAIVEPAAHCWQMVVNGNAHNISAKELYKLIASAIDESAQIVSYTRECVFGTTGANGNEDGHTMIIPNATYTNTNNEVIELGTIRLSLAHRHWLGMVAAMGWFMTGDPDLEVLGSIVTFVFGDDHTLPSNAVNFERLWQAYNLLAMCKKGVYMLKDEQDVVDAFAPAGRLDRLHINHMNVFQSEELMSQAMALTEEDRVNRLLARAAEKVATEKVAPKIDPRTTIVTKFASERPFGNKSKLDQLS